jgi:WD40 repeat protein
MFFSSYRQGKEFKVSLWKMGSSKDQESADGELVYGLTSVLSLKGINGLAKSLWNPVEGTDVVTLDQKCLRLWHLNSGCSEVKDNAASKDVSGLNAGCWDPHHRNQFVSVSGKDIRAWDLTTMMESSSIINAHEDIIRDIDYNPNKPYHLVTGGDDRRIRLWDLRKGKQPLKILGGHSHWAWSVKYNRSHDQLLVSSGTDGNVNLWSIVSTSSAPLGDLEDPVNEKEGDKLIKTYEEHEDSVYSVAWSCCDAWIFASLSYDGRVVINHVPPAEKYKILL